LLSGSFTEYRLFQGKFFKPALIYKSENSQPLTDTTESGLSAANKLKLHPDYQPEIYFDNYNPLGNLLQYHKAQDDRHQTYLWGYHQLLPVAEVKNARPAQVLYTGFEEDGVESSQAKTGRRIFNGSYNLTLPTLNGKYLLTYWQKPVNNREWEYVRETVEITESSARSKSIGGDGVDLDEVRLFPVDAVMTTYTYDPLIGMTSSTDANNITTYYDYDGLGRLFLIKDDKGNILKKYDYQYAGQ
jgi:YD repeat-containing protein